MILNLIKSFVIGSIAYLMSILWINWGNLEPTMKTNNIGYVLNSIFLFFG